MNCREIEVWLQSYLDGDSLPPSPDELSHLKACTQCHERWQAAELLLNTLQSAQEPTVPAQLSNKIFSELPQNPHVSWWRKYQRSFAIAAGVLIALGLVTAYWWYNSANSSSNVAKRSSTPHRPQPKQAFQGQEEIEKHLQDVRDGSLKAANNALDQTVEHVAMFFPQMPETPTIQVEPPAIKLDQMGKTVANGLQPLSNTAKRAWNRFWDRLPAPEENIPG